LLKGVRIRAKDKKKLLCLEKEKNFFPKLPEKLQDILERKKIKNNILRHQEQTEWTLGQTIKVGWEKMNEEERKTILKLASLSKQLKKQFKKAFRQDRN